MISIAFYLSIFLTKITPDMTPTKEFICDMGRNRHLVAFKQVNHTFMGAYAIALSMCSSLRRDVGVLLGLARAR